MRFEKTIDLEVTDWPRFQRVTRFTLDSRLFSDERSLRAFAQGRFGEGTLQQSNERQWIYARRLPGPRFFWGILSRVLNRSYA